MSKQQFLTKLGEFKFSEPNTNSGWLHVFTLGTVWDKRYGFIEITPTRVRRFASNVNDKILGTDVPVDFSHMNGPDGERAAGWGTKAVTTDPNGSNEEGLWLWVDWTPRAADEIRGGEWKYASAMFTEIWSDARGHQHQDVLLGTALTNHPVLKDLTPINLSDFHDDEEVIDYLLDNPVEHFDLAAVDNSAWDGNAAMTNCKGASDYRAICAGRREGDPNKRETWALPHHKTPGAPPNSNGVRAALGRFEQTEGLINKDGARRHLEAHQRAIQSMSDVGGEFDLDLKVLATLFGLPEEATEDQVLAKGRSLLEFYTAKAPEEEKQKEFAELFPEQAKQLEESNKRVADLENANRLSEINNHITKLTEGGKYALPPAVIDDLREVRQQLTADADNKLAAIFDALIKDGLVELDERGSTRGNNGEEGELTFEEAIAKAREEDKELSYGEAVKKVSAEQPELAAEWQKSVKPGGDN